MRRVAQLAVLAAVAIAWACGRPEDTVVTQYFNALKAKDNQTLSSFAAVNFDKVVESYKIVGYLEETKGPAPLPSLIKAAKDAEEAVAANKREAGNYRNDHFSDWEQLQDLQKKNQPVPPKLGPFAEKWGQFTHKDQELRKAAAQAKEAVEKERRLAVLSVGQLDDLEALQGEVVQKRLEVELKIAGQPQAHTMTLRRYNLNRTGAGPRIMSRWVIQNLQPKA